MGFPVGYTELYLPKLFLHALSLLLHLRTLKVFLFRRVGLPHFLEPRLSSSSALDPYPEDVSVSALVLREFLPVVKFADLVDPTADSCAVCLSDFAGEDETRRLANCCHVFHRGCLDRWMGFDRRTCPLCRSPIIPEDVREAFNERLWAAFGIPELYAGDLY